MRAISRTGGAVERTGSGFSHDKQIIPQTRVFNRARACRVSLGGCGPLENPTARHRLLGIDSQHGRSLLWVTPSPLICSRAIFITSASKSARESFSQTRSRRRARSFRTQSSLLSGLSASRCSEFEAAASRVRINLSLIDILPHLAAKACMGAEAELRRRLRLLSRQWDV